MKHSLRRLFKAPAFALTAIITVGAAIGANALIFSVVNGVILKPLPYADPKSLVTDAATTSLDTGRPFADVLVDALDGTDVSRAEIDAALDPSSHTGESAALVDAFLASRSELP